MSNAKNKPYLYQVNHARTSGGPKFTSISEAVKYIAHCMKEGEPQMTIFKL